MAIDLLATFKDAGYLYFVFEYCPYGTLADVALGFENNIIPEYMAKYYTAQIASFLDFIHEKGVVHRDLKPENVLISDSKKVKIIDFGDAKYLDEDKNLEFQQGESDGEDSDFIDDLVQEDEVSPEREPARRRGTFVGTALYVSPEMLQSNEAGPEADFWALGVIIYKLSFGKAPFEGCHENVTFEKILKREIEFPVDAD